MDSFLNKRIGILGGTFNPVHLGHLLLAQSAVEAYDLSRIVFIPCAVPAHKNPSSLISSSHRLSMLENAIEPDLRYEASDIEIVRGGTSYAIDTVGSLIQLYPSAELFFIIGADTLLELSTWKDIDELLKLCNFIVVQRPGCDFSNISPEALGFDQAGAEQLLQNVTTGRQVNISSSDIRRRIAEGMSIHYLVPEQVEMYITEHNLYK